MKLNNNKKIFAAITLSLAIGSVVGYLIGQPNHQSDSSSDNQQIGESVNQIWTCSMHPQIRQGEPGDCPICGMDLILLEKGGGDEADPQAVSMSAAAMQLADVQTAIVGTTAPTKRIKLNGKIQADERLIYSQSTHFPGRIERLAVNYTGEYVTRERPVAYLYSPKLVTAQEELFEAQKIRESQPELYRAARAKLTNWKLTETQIDEILSSEKARTEFPVNSNYSGYVLEKNVSLGDYVSEGQALYQIADLTRVWALFDLYESELGWIQKGDSVAFTVASIPGETFKGAIDFIAPLIDPESRVAKARVVVANPRGVLKPEMFASAMVEASVGGSDDELVIPKSAVMWTGKRSVVYVKITSETGLHFQLREVVLGPSLEDSYVMENGLKAGEEIAVSGTFSVDAAAQLAGKTSMMSPEASAASNGHHHGENLPEGSHSKTITAAHQVNETTQKWEVAAEFSNQLKVVFSKYLLLKDQLVKSDAPAGAKAAADLNESLQKVEMSLLEGKAHKEWMKDVKVLDETSLAIAAESELENQRILFSPLSDQLFHSLSKFKVDVNAYRQYCPMAMDFDGAYWLSDSDEIRNPYFGDEMMTCGSVEAKIKP